MIHQVRRSCWETNSSSMNQIAINTALDMGTTTRYIGFPSYVVMENYSDPEKTVYDPIEKLRFIYALLLDVTFDNDVDQSTKDRCKSSFDELMRRYGIEYDDPVPVLYREEAIGMAGVTDETIELLTNVELMDRFISLPASGYTIGEINTPFNYNRRGAIGPDEVGIGYEGPIVKKADYWIREV